MSKGVIIEDPECAAKLEELAREQAFNRFQAEILFSLSVWQTDKVVQSNCKNVIEWIKECAVTLLELAGDRSK